MGFIVTDTYVLVAKLLAISIILSLFALAESILSFVALPDVLRCLTALDQSR